MERPAASSSTARSVCAILTPRRDALRLRRRLHRRRSFIAARERQENREFAAFAALAAAIDAAAMAGHDAVDDGKAKAGALADILGCEEGLEDTAEIRGVDPAARIGDREAHAKWRSRS